MTDVVFAIDSILVAVAMSQGARVRWCDGAKVGAERVRIAPSAHQPSPATLAPMPPLVFLLALLARLTRRLTALAPIRDTIAQVDLNLKPRRGPQKNSQLKGRGGNRQSTIGNRQSQIVCRSLIAVYHANWW